VAFFVREFSNMDILFCTALIVFAFSNTKIEAWGVIGNLGLKSELPEAFLRNPKMYVNLQYGMLAILIIIGFFTHYIPWYVAIIVTFVVSNATYWLGMKSAFKKYRKILKEMLEYAETDEEKETYKQQLNQSTDAALAMKLEQAEAMAKLMKR
jgi:hypothetical protein